MGGMLDSLKASDVHLKSVVHVGASYGQEVRDYFKHGIESCFLIEPIPEVFNFLEETYKSDSRIKLARNACVDKPEKLDFYIAANEGMSSSIYPEINENIHSVGYCGKIEVDGLPLDDILKSHAEEIDLLVVDAQGSEVKVFTGAKETLKRTKYIFTEVSRIPLYTGACVMSDVTSILKESGFSLLKEFLNDRGTGDALYWKE